MFAMAVALAIACKPAFAHHGAAAYDVDKRLTLRGTVTQWIWSNPHCLLQLDVTDESGQVMHWIMESENPLTMANLGWSKEAIKVGDQVTVTVMPVKNGRPIGRIMEIVLASGQKLNGEHRIPGVNPDTLPKPDEPAKP
jgi:hypothetical protein